MSEPASDAEIRVLWSQGCDVEEITYHTGRSLDYVRAVIAVEDGVDVAHYVRASLRRAEA